MTSSAYISGAPKKQVNSVNNLLKKTNSCRSIASSGSGSAINTTGVVSGPSGASGYLQSFPLSSTGIMIPQQQPQQYTHRSSGNGKNIAYSSNKKMTATISTNAGTTVGGGRSASSLENHNFAQNHNQTHQSSFSMVNKVSDKKERASTKNNCSSLQRP